MKVYGMIKINDNLTPNEALWINKSWWPNAQSVKMKHMELSYLAQREF